MPGSNRRRATAIANKSSLSGIDFYGSTLKDSMANNDNAVPDNASKNSDLNITRQDSLLGEDIHDSPEDEEKMKNETVIIDLPDVSDIPGQENIVIPVIGEMAD